MTEEEAKTKWCPFARVADTGDKGHITVNRHNGAPYYSETFCIASACMAWRWDVDHEISLDSHAGDKEWYETVRADLNKHATFQTVWVRRFKNQNGHCGLAGQP